MANNELPIYNVFADESEAGEDFASAIIHSRMTATTIKFNNSLYHMLKQEEYFQNALEKLENGSQSCPETLLLHGKRWSKCFSGSGILPVKELKFVIIFTSSNNVIGEQLFEAWERYKEYLDRSPNHGFPDQILKEKFYRGLDPMTQAIANNAAGGCFLNKSFANITNILDQLTTHSQAWNSSKSDGLSLGTLLIQNIRLDEREAKKVNVCEDISGVPPGIYQCHEGPYQEGPPQPVEDVQHADYVAKGDGAYNNNQGNFNNNQGNYNNNYGGANQGRYNNNNGNYGNRSSNPYIPPKGQSNDQGSSRLESMLEKQMRDLSREQHPARKGGLPSDTIPNPKNGSGVECTFAISMRSGKILQSADKKVVDLDPVIEEEEVHSDVPIVDDEVHIEEKAADIPDVTADTRKQTIKGALRPLTQMYKAKPPFLRDAVKEMPGFAKFLKDPLRRKGLFNMSLIIASTTVQKKGDPGAFTIPCNIGLHAFARALCDNGVSINLMPLAIFKQFGLGIPRLTSMRLQMADKSIKKPVGVIDDVLVEVGKFMLPADFVILDCAIDKDIFIILGRPFLATGRALIDSEKNEIKFRVNDEEVTFQESKGMKLPSAYESISIIDSFDGIDDAIDHKMEEESLGEALATVLLDLDLANRTTSPVKPFIFEPPKLELKQLPSHLRYEFLGPNKTLPVIVLALLTEEQIERLVKILH
ncbi:uncharacterized protein LOC132062392 [Lycium ferocissimum]|uniref:uncharacterized protein LOC132062392 n=1 Tax=Lycium ferocissimum TaxID=112874 RepID=UPI0028164C30|nr:uncharacterized protein LOC132062392 [Lycium ferocissimum]